MPTYQFKLLPPAALPPDLTPPRADSQIWKTLLWLRRQYSPDIPFTVGEAFLLFRPLCTNDPRLGTPKRCTAPSFRSRIYYLYDLGFLARRSHDSWTISDWMQADPASGDALTAFKQPTTPDGEQPGDIPLTADQLMEISRLERKEGLSTAEAIARVLQHQGKD